VGESVSVRIAPSLLACDLARVGEEVASVCAAGADLLHFDVMDGVFVPNLSFGPSLCGTVRRLTELPLDVHLMVEDPDRLVDQFIHAGANRISVHVEAVTHLHRTLAHIRERGASPGVALNPLTPVVALDEIWPHVDFVLAMTVNPGFGGQTLIASTLDKISRLNRTRLDRYPRVELVADGGIDCTNCRALKDHGIDVLVAGTAVFGEADRRRAITALRGEEQS